MGIRSWIFIGIGLVAAACSSSSDDSTGDAGAIVIPQKGFSQKGAEPASVISNSTANTAFEKTSHRELLDHLDQFLAKRPSQATSEMQIKDVRWMLVAQVAEDERRDADAQAAWFEALQYAEGRFGRKALYRWLKSKYRTNNDSQKPTSRELARKVLADIQTQARPSGSSLLSIPPSSSASSPEPANSAPTAPANSASSKSKEHRSVPFLESQGLVTEEKLSSYLDDIAPELIEKPEAKISAQIEAPAKGGIPSGDPVLTKTAKGYCQGRPRNDAPWRKWVGKLPKNVAAYWGALIAECAGRGSDAALKYRQLYPLLASNRATQAMALESASRLIKLRRSTGERESVADDYMLLMKAWTLPNISDKALGLENRAYFERRLDETLWAARYRALIGDLENTKLIAQHAADIAAEAGEKTKGAPKAFKEFVASSYADAQHIVAFRVDFERKDFASAIAFNTAALQTPNLNQEWRDRLQFLSGFYEYLGGHIDLAAKRWQDMITASMEESQRPVVYFWLARAHGALQHNQERDYYIQELLKDYPTSFYSVVALSEVGLTEPTAWIKQFGDVRGLQAKLGARRDYGLGSLRRQKTLGRLLMRAEILAAAQIPEWGRLAVSELDESMQKQLSMEASTAAFVYLSRLHYAVGNLFACIAVTTQLQTTVEHFWAAWPEQILVNFPEPFQETYGKVARDTAVAVEQMLAISRQESSFRPDVRSPANAFGVMQVVKRTAERYLSEAKVGRGSVESILLDPASNIAIGGRYMRDLNAKFNSLRPAVFAAYNAGEYAVATWLERRRGTDQIFFVEGIPYGETKGYVRNVWRNEIVYKVIQSQGGHMASWEPSDVGILKARGELAIGERRGGVGHHSNKIRR